MNELNPNLIPAGSPLAIMLGNQQFSQLQGQPPAMPQAPPAAFQSNPQPPRPLQGAPSPPPPPPPHPAAPPGAPPAQSAPAQAQNQEQDLLQRAYQRSDALQAAMGERMGLYQQGASALKDLLAQTANTLSQTPVEPSMAERYGRLAAAMGSPTRTGTFGERMGNVGGASAQVLEQAREAELAKQQLMAKYGIQAGELGMQIPMAGLQQLTSMLNSNDSRLTSLAIAKGRQNPIGATIIMGANGQPQINQPVIDAKAQLAAEQAVAVQKAKQALFSGSFTPEALDLLSEQAYRTGKVNIPYGLTRNDPTIVSRVWDMAAAKAASDGNSAAQTVASQHAYQATTSALGALTKQATLVGAYEKTAEKNMDLAFQLGNQVDRSNSPLINKGIIAWKQGITGDPETAGFVNALTAAENEYAKVLSGATGAAGITDAARKEAHDLFSKIDSQQMLAFTIGPQGVARTEMHNRMGSFNEQQTVLNDMMTRHGGVAQPAGQTPAAGGPPAAVPTATGPNGQKLYLRNGAWVSQ
jgi:hypothetical protein